MAKRFGLLLILIICLPLIACSGAGSPEEVSTATNIPEISAEPTAAPARPTGTSVTTVDQIVGTWIAPADLGNFVMTIFPDGKLSIATSLVDLEQGSTDSWKLTIEDGQISATGYALCLGDTGAYLAVINEGGTLKFTSIIDAVMPGSGRWIAVCQAA